VLYMVLGLPTLINVLGYVRRWRLHPVDPDAEPLPLVVVLAAFVAECLATTALVVTWPFGWFSSTDRPHGSGRVIVLVPGLLLNAASLWPLRARLRRLGWEVVTCPGAAFRIGAAAQERALDECLAKVGARDVRITLVAFGRGGRTARRCLARRPHARIGRLITVGTLHRAAGDANSIASAGTDAAEGGRLPYQMDVVAMYSDLDAVVPAAGAYYPGAFNIEVRGVGHVSLLISRRVFELLIENIDGGGRFR